MTDHVDICELDQDSFICKWQKSHSSEVLGAGPLALWGWARIWRCRDVRATWAKFKTGKKGKCQDHRARVRPQKDSKAGCWGLRGWETHRQLGHFPSVSAPSGISGRGCISSVAPTVCDEAHLGSRFSGVTQAWSSGNTASCLVPQACWCQSGCLTNPIWLLSSCLTCIISFLHKIPSDLNAQSGLWFPVRSGFPYCAACLWSLQALEPSNTLITSDIHR